VFQQTADLRHNRLFLKNATFIGVANALAMPHGDKEFLEKRGRARAHERFFHGLEEREALENRLPGLLQG